MEYICDRYVRRILTLWVRQRGRGVGIGCLGYIKDNRSVAMRQDENALMIASKPAMCLVGPGFRRWEWLVVNKIRPTPRPRLGA